MTAGTEVSAVPDFDSRVAVVIGGAGGIGSAVGLALAQAGASVALFDLSSAGLADVAAEAVERGVAERILLVRGDAGVEVDVERLFIAVEARFGCCDALVLATVEQSWAPLESTDLSAFEATVAGNLTASFLSLRRAGLAMPPGGAAVIVSSVCAELPSVMSGAYSATKAAQISLARQAAAEWQTRGSRVNALSIGMAVVGMAAGFQTDATVVRERSARIPARRIGRSEEIVQALLFLLSDRSSALSGQNLVVDGGFAVGLFATASNG